MTPEQLEHLKLSSKFTQELNFKNKTFLCKVVDVYDGDTVKVVFYFHDVLYRWNVRLYGINTPEMRPSKLNPLRKSIKANAIKSRDFLKSLFQTTNNLVYIECGDFDKYGRLLGTFFYKDTISFFDESINYAMILGGYAKEYLK
jgi:endonuclease YncB( thermonuclease family)